MRNRELEAGSFLVLETIPRLTRVSHATHTAFAALPGVETPVVSVATQKTSDVVHHTPSKLRAMSSGVSVRLRQRPLEQLLQRLVIGLQAAQQNAVIVGQREEGTRHPVSRHGDAQRAAAIVAHHGNAF